MASMCVSASTAVVALWAPPLHTPSPSPPSSSSCLSSLSNSSFRCSLSPKGLLIPALRCGGVRRSHVVRMAPEEERITRRSPLDFPIVSLSLSLSDLYLSFYLYCFFTRFVGNCYVE